MPRGVLLVNLGSPASPDVADVRRYLNEFLMDGHVINLPWLLRRILVSGFILPFRPKASAAAYASIWDGERAPLIEYTAQFASAVSEGADVPVAFAMRYGSPSIADGLEQLRAAGADGVLLVPLYPQYADSTVTTSIERTRELLPPGWQMEVHPSFFDDEGYLDAQAAVIARHLPEQWDHLLLSYHGLPEAQLQKADPTGAHCLADASCCETPSPAHATCYRMQSRSTSRAIAARLGLAPEQWSESYQSRLGRLPWLTPYTDQTLVELPSRGVRRLVVACPAFVADNLETLEEIGIQGRELFMAAGGESLTLVPCLNDDPSWVATATAWCVEPD